MIFETIAIRKVWAAIKAVPWQVYAIGALVAAIPINGCVQYNKGYDNGAESVKAELRAAQSKAAETALKAAAQADEKALERAEAEAEVIERQLDAIERAEANDENPLDALFN